jgi:hypothetical protein
MKRYINNAVIPTGVREAEIWRDLVSRSLPTITGFLIVPDRSPITQLPNDLLTQ